MALAAWAEHDATALIIATALALTRAFSPWLYTFESIMNVGVKPEAGE